jgi:hypothetical protein
MIGYLPVRKQACQGWFVGNCFGKRLARQRADAENSPPDFCLRRKTMKKKKLWRYVQLADTEVDGEKFPATKARKKFLLPWRVHGKGLSGKLV